MRVLSVVGARPQFVKLAPVDRALRERGHEHVIVDTGQHYDPLLSRAFFDDLAIPGPMMNLGIGSGGHAAQTACILTGLEPALAGQSLDWVLVYGDTNSTLGGALAAAQHGLPLAHLEAGLRSFDRRMPEERNRVVADHLSDLLLAPSVFAVRNLAGEGLTARAVLVGDVMVDALAEIRARVTAAPERYLPAFSRGDPYLIATIHRAETTDDPAQLAAALRALAALPLTVPLPYPSMIAAMMASRGLVTDSGGLQKEALLLGVPCTTLRPVTEWPETLRDGWNVLVPRPEDLPEAVLRARPAGKPPQPYGNGDAASLVVSALAGRVGQMQSAA
jgi:UDP-N-acetylglucosamine 2-epimerase (non-hydrolysing)